MTLDEIKKCKYLSSVGMLKLLDEHNIITYDENPDKITHDFSKLFDGKDGDCIYVKFAFIRDFIYRIFPNINYKFILITGDGDETMPFNFFDLDTFVTIINDEKIIHWFSVNCIENLHPKFSLIPIGVNFHSLSFGSFSGWSNDVQSPLEQENEIISVLKDSKPFYEREIKCYSNFHFVTYNEFGNPRKDAIEKIPKNLVYYEPNFVSRMETWKNQTKYSFVLSPLGHGMDCHRTWEALILGCIVIVKTSPLDSLYENLPVLILNDWGELTEDLLQNTVDKFKNIEFDYNKLTARYWVDKIKSKNTYE
jgi:hypothetical protein